MPKKSNQQTHPPASTSAPPPAIRKKRKVVVAASAPPPIQVPFDATELFRIALGPPGPQPCDSSTPQTKVALSRVEKKYLDNLSADEAKEAIRGLENSVSQSVVPIRFRVANSSLPNKAEILQRLSGGCDQSGKYEAWVERALRLPLATFTPRPIASATDGVEAWIRDVRLKMDECLYGQNEAKDQVILHLVQFATSKSSRPEPLGLQGPAGIGKTSFLKVLASVMNRPSSFFQLGGLSGAENLVGHSYTFEGSQCGALAAATCDHQVMDGLYVFDELDKLSESPRGAEVASVLIHLTDSTQNDHVAVDRYFSGIDMDYSRAFFIFSYNDASKVNPILLDRMTQIKFSIPSMRDKIQIARRHIIPRALEKAGMKDDDVQFTDDLLRAIVLAENPEPGLRNFDRAICRIVNTINVLQHNSGGCLRGIETPQSVSLPLALTESLAMACLKRASAPAHTGPPPLMYA
tara:strand:+ start:59 stop:1450 length:1392 start_codon:yes stop_codon:yes gene_type:complete